MSSAELEYQRLSTLNALKLQTPTWLDLRARNARTCGLDVMLEAEYGMTNSHMDYLLEEYFKLMSGVELDAASL